MIRYVDSPALRARLSEVLAGEDLLHACILSTYLNALERPDFWLCLRGESPGGALLRMGDEFLFCSGEAPDLGELQEFLRFMDCRCLCARLPVLRELHGPLSLPPPEHAPAMALRAAAPPSLSLAEPGVSIAREHEELREVYALILENYEGFDNYGGGPGCDAWLSGMRLRERDGVCGVWTLRVQGALAATASVVAASARCIDIGAVVTRRELRGRGYAASLVRHLAAVAAQSGRIPVLGCANEGLADYYRRLGFETYDRWAVAERT